MNHPLSGWVFAFTVLVSVIAIFRAVIDDDGLDESHMRLISLVMGVPLTVMLALEGLLSAWGAGAVVAGVVAFATRPWD